MAITTEVCMSCHRLFNYPGFGAKFCPSCKEKDNETRAKIKAFLDEHGTANMYEIAQGTGVSERLIKQYLREGMLEIPEGSPVYIKCEKCGCDIRSGRWCPECAARLSADLRGVYTGVGDKPKESGKMRFLGRNRDK